MADSEARRNVELLATAVGVGAVLLPLGGVVVRTVAFWSLNADDVREIILGDSIGSLAASGFKAILASAGFLLALIVWIRAAPLLYLVRATKPRVTRIIADGTAILADSEQFSADIDAARAEADAGTLTEPALKELQKRTDDFLQRAKELDKAKNELEASEDWKRLQAAAPSFRPTNRVLLAIGRAPGWIPMVISGLIWFGFAVFISDWPSSLPLFMAWVVVGVAAPMLAARGHLFQFTGVFAITATVVLLCAVGSGLAGVSGNEYLADYNFKSDANLQSGPYVHLGESNGLLFLQDCKSRQFVAVNVGSVAHINEASYRELPQGPSLWDVVIHRRGPIVGYRSEC